jgi:hypothetical protein
MAVDALNEELLTFGQAARRARPKGSRPAAPSTIWRWHSKGIAGVRLETLCLGGTRYTSAEALQRFFDAVTQAREEQGPASNSTSELGTRSQHTERRLQDLGLTDD